MKNLISRLVVFFLVVILALLWLIFVAIVRLLMMLERHLHPLAADVDLIVSSGVPAGRSPAQIEIDEAFVGLENYYKDNLLKKSEG